MGVQTHDVESSLAAECRRFQDADIPAEALNAAERCMLDWLGCALTGARMPAAQGVARALEDELQGGAALELARLSKTTVGNAALINGTAAHVAELDDIYSPALYHPGAPVIAAVLATACATNATGAQILRAVIAGYEVSNAIGAAMNPAHYEFWHTTGTVGTLGAAVAAASLLELSADRIAWTIGHAASMAAGLQQAFRSDGMTKPLHAGRAAEGGTLAARLAEAGVTGAKGMLSGPSGLGNAMSAEVDWETAFAALFKDFTIERTTFKRFAACGHTFAAVDAVLELIEREGIRPEAVRQVMVDTYQKAIDVAGNAQPKTPFEARFSIQYGVAAAISGRDLTRPSSYDTGFDDPDIQAMMTRIHLNSSTAVNEGYPRLRGAEVTIELEGGERHVCTMKTRRGDPANPLTDDQLSRKFDRLVNEVAGATVAPLLVSWVRSLKHSGPGAMDKLAEHLRAELEPENVRSA